jgi:hypothetical protein
MKSQCKYNKTAEYHGGLKFSHNYILKVLPAKHEIEYTNYYVPTSKVPRQWQEEMHKRQQLQYPISISTMY